MCCQDPIPARSANSDKRPGRIHDESIASLRDDTSPRCRRPLGASFRWLCRNLTLMTVLHEVGAIIICKCTMIECISSVNRLPHDPFRNPDRDFLVQNRRERQISHKLLTRTDPRIRNAPHTPEVWRRNADAPHPALGQARMDVTKPPSPCTPRCRHARAASAEMTIPHPRMHPTSGLCATPRPLTHVRRTVGDHTP